MTEFSKPEQSERLSDLLDADWARLTMLSGQPGLKRTWLRSLGPRMFHITVLRVAMVQYRRGNRRLARLFSMLNMVIFGLEVPPRLAIGPGLIIPHPQGTILGAREIGKNFTVMQQVTLGAKSVDFKYDMATRPRIGDNVTVAAGAKVLGPVVLGHGCTVGANAVVLNDVPDGAVAVGVPARIQEARRS